MSEHPIYRMWKQRLDEEHAWEAARAARRAAKESELAGWYEAWRSYKARLTEASKPTRLPRWWNLIGWVRRLIRLHAAGRPN